MSSHAQTCAICGKHIRSRDKRSSCYTIIHNQIVGGFAQGIRFPGLRFTVYWCYAEHTEEEELDAVHGREKELLREMGWARVGGLLVPRNGVLRKVPE